MSGDGAYTSTNAAVKEASPTPQPWRIVAATCVQRMPLLIRERPKLEARVEELKDKLRWERARLSDFELEERENSRLKREREKRALDEDLDGVQVSNCRPSIVKGLLIIITMLLTFIFNTASFQGVNDDFMDAFDELIEARETELSSFTPASRQTEADKSNDLKSVQRKLDQVLYLLVKKNRKEHAWQMPQGGLEGDESLVEVS